MCRVNTVTERTNKDLEKSAHTDVTREKTTNTVGHGKRQSTEASLMLMYNKLH